MLKYPFLFKSLDSSMFPVIAKNDIISIRKIIFSDIKVNDLVVINKNGLSVAHRVIYKKKNYVITKGDNSNETDRRIFANDILGKVIQISRNGRIFDPELIYHYYATKSFDKFANVINKLITNNINHVVLNGLIIYMYLKKDYPRYLSRSADFLVDSTDLDKMRRILKKNSFIKFNPKLFSETQRNSSMESETYYKKIGDVLMKVNLLTEKNLIKVFDKVFRPKNINISLRKLILNFLNNKKCINIRDNRFYILSKTDQIVFNLYDILLHKFKGYKRYELIVLLIKSSSSRNIVRTLENIKFCNLQTVFYPVLTIIYKYYPFTKLSRMLSTIRPGFMTLFKSRVYQKNTNIFNF